jgi:hypothetical protein
MTRTPKRIYRSNRTIIVLLISVTAVGMCAFQFLLALLCESRESCSPLLEVCVAAGAPLVFVPDQGSQIYIVVSERNSVRVPQKILDQIGVPGIVILGRVLDSDGLEALAVAGLEP